MAMPNTAAEVRRRLRDEARLKRAQQRINQAPIGQNAIDAAMKLLQPVADTYKRVTNAVKKATPWADGLDDLAKRVERAADRLPSSVVAQGAAQLTQQGMAAANVDPRVGLALTPLLLGRVSPGAADDAAKALRRTQRAARNRAQQQRLNRAKEALRAQGVTGPFDGKPIGGQPPTAAEKRALERFFSGRGKAQTFSSDPGRDVVNPKTKDATINAYVEGAGPRTARVTGGGEGQPSARRALGKSVQKAREAQGKPVVGERQLLDDVNRYVDERNNPRRFNQIEAAERGGVELPPPPSASKRSKVDRRGRKTREAPSSAQPMSDRDYVLGKGYKPRSPEGGKNPGNTRSFENIPGGRFIPETAVEQARRDQVAAAGKRAKGEATVLGRQNLTRVVNDAIENYRDALRQWKRGGSQGQRPRLRLPGNEDQWLKAQKDPRMLKAEIEKAMGVGGLANTKPEYLEVQQGIRDNLGNVRRQRAKARKQLQSGQYIQQPRLDPNDTRRPSRSNASSVLRSANERRRAAELAGNVEPDFNKNAQVATERGFLGNVPAYRRDGKSTPSNASAPGTGSVRPGASKANPRREVPENVSVAGTFGKRGELSGTRAIGKPSRLGINQMRVDGQDPAAGGRSVRQTRAAQRVLREVQGRQKGSNNQGWRADPAQMTKAQMAKFKREQAEMERIRKLRAKRRGRR